jgi:hypothetical protein
LPSGSTLLIRNVPIFLGALSGVAAKTGGVTAWAIVVILFVLAALIQNYLFEEPQR